MGQELTYCEYCGKCMGYMERELGEERNCSPICEDKARKFLTLTPKTLVVSPEIPAGEMFHLSANDHHVCGGDYSVTVDYDVDWKDE